MRIDVSSKHIVLKHAIDLDLGIKYANVSGNQFPMFTEFLIMSYNRFARSYVHGSECSQKFVNFSILYS